MNRADLGDFGSSMTEGELAQALAGFVSLRQRFSFPLRDVRYVAEALREIASDEIISAPWYWQFDVNGFDDEDAKLLAQAWRMGIVEPGIKVRVELQGRDLEVDAWLARQLRHAAVGALSVYHRIDEPDWPVAWEWPLRLGVLGGARAPRNRKLFDALAQVHHRNLWRVVNMHEPGTECELLLLPGDQRQALKDLLDAPHRPRADCAFVLDSRELSSGRSATLALAIRREARAAGVATLSSGHRLDGVLTALVAELSHDKTLDVALSEAMRYAGRFLDVKHSAAELICSRTLATHTSIRLSAARLARDLSGERASIPLTQSGLPAGESLVRSSGIVAGPLEASRLALPTAFEPAGAQMPPSLELDRLVRHGQWEYESSDATRLVDIRSAAEDLLGRTHRSARMLGDAETPQPLLESDTREVLTDVLLQGEGIAVRALLADESYLLRVRIDEPDGESVGSGTPFPTDRLPPSGDGHRLDVSFVPLVATVNGERAPSQQATIFLAPAGSSNSCSFPFSTGGIEGAFRARLLISYENTVLQTLRLDADLAGGDTPYKLVVENIVQAGFHNLAYRQPFDAAIVVNHSAEGLPGITALVGNRVEFGQPQGMAQAIQALQETLTNNTALQQAESDLNSEALCELVYGLMQHGRILFDEVESYIGTLDRDAARIQVVDARAGAAFPVEYLYPLEVPAERPPMCPHAAGALRGDAEGVTHQDCVHRDDPEHMCPVRFWGFRKQVERQPADILPTSAHGDMTTLTVPGVLSGKLNLLQRVQVAKSKKVQPADYDLPSGLLQVLNQHCEMVFPSNSWAQWKGKIQECSPGLLLLLSHSDTDANSNLPALEIGNTKLPLASIEASYVKGPQADAPVVFLLGCDTADPNLGFINFVSRFKRKQAALVVGTLSTISGQRAARFLAGALPLFKQAQGSGRTFGDVFLQVKRAALAEGDGFALSLVAYGDTSWQL